MSRTRTPGNRPTAISHPFCWNYNSQLTTGPFYSTICTLTHIAAELTMHRHRAIQISSPNIKGSPQGGHPSYDRPTYYLPVTRAHAPGLARRFDALC